MEHEQARTFPPPPRSVRRRRDARRRWRRLGEQTGLLIGGVAILAMCGVWCRDGLVRFTGRAVTAHVTRTWMTHGKGVGYHVAYRYAVDGQVCGDDDDVPGDIYSSFYTGREVPAQTTTIFGYCTAQLMLGRHVYWSERWVIGMMLAIWLAIFIPAVREGWLRPAAEKRALRIGQIVPGQIHRKRTYRDKNNTSYRVVYGYAPHFAGGSRAPVEREVDVDHSTFDGFDEGAGVTVFYDAQKPKLGVAYELSDFEIVADSG